MRRNITVVAGFALAAVALAAGCGTGGIPSAGEDVARGKALFIERCASCHTLADAGAPGKVGPNLDDAFAAGRRQGFEESTIRTVVRGQIEIPRVGSAMPPGLVTGDDADAVAAYVASVAGKEGASLPTTTAAPEGAGSGPAAGKRVFASAGCGACHALADAGASGTVGPNLDEQRPSVELAVERVTSGKGIMPPFKGRLTDAQIAAVAAYVSSVAGK